MPASRTSFPAVTPSSPPEEDFYVPLPDELRLIGDAGFPRPDVFWRDGLIAVYGGFKSE